MKAHQNSSVRKAGTLCHCKTVLLGESSVGKSSIVLKFIQGAFHDFQEPTIGAAFTSKILPIKNSSVKFEIWDTAGQERYYSLTPMYYRGARAVIVVYDITNVKSFLRAQAWVKELQRYARSDVIIILAGNKSDLTEHRTVDYEAAETYAMEKELLFIETSARSGENVNKLFATIAESLLANGASNQIDFLPPDDNESVKLTDSAMSLKRGKVVFCCAT